MAEPNDSQMDPEYGLLLAHTGQAVDANSTRSMAPWVQSTALRTAGLRFRSLGLGGETRCGEEFLINSRLVRNNRENDASILHYFEDSTTVMLSRNEERQAGEGETIGLPPGVALQMSLGEAVQRRRSVRVYTGDPMPLDYLAAIIRAAVGFTGEASVTLTTGQTVRLRFRSTPSGGGLYPVQLYVAALNVKRLARGVYRYDPHHHCLVRFGEAAMVERLLPCMALPEEVISVSRANALCLLVGKPWRSMRKYGTRGMRLVFMEAGYIAQNLHLATTALGFGSVDCSGMFDDEAHEALGLDGVYATLVHTVVLGCAQ